MNINMFHTLALCSVLFVACDNGNKSTHENIATLNNPIPLLNKQIPDKTETKKALLTDNALALNIYTH